MSLLFFVPFQAPLLDPPGRQGAVRDPCAVRGEGLLHRFHVLSRRRCAGTSPHIFLSSRSSSSLLLFSSLVLSVCELATTVGGQNSRCS